MYKIYIIHIYELNLILRTRVLKFSEIVINYLHQQDPKFSERKSVKIHLVLD